MKILIGFLLMGVGMIIFVLGDKQVSKYGIVSRWLLDPPYFNGKYKKLGRQLQKWVLGGLLFYFGLILVFGKI